MTAYSKDNSHNICIYTDKGIPLIIKCLIRVK